MPSPITFLLLDCLLKHGPKPTISASRRGSGSSCSHRIAQRSPAACRGNEMDLAIECPLAPLLADAIAHNESSHVVVGALVQMIGPALQHRDARDLHVEYLQPLIQSRHLADEVVDAAPCALRVLGDQVPHLIEASLGVELHEPNLERRRRERRRGRWPHRFDRRRQRRERPSKTRAHRRADEAAEVVGGPGGELPGNPQQDAFEDGPAT